MPEGQSASESAAAPEGGRRGVEPVGNDDVEDDDNNDDEDNDGNEGNIGDTDNEDQDLAMKAVLVKEHNTLQERWLSLA